MQLPFDKDKEPEKYRFYQEITAAINDWMLKQYPMFDTNLQGKIEKLEKLQNDIQLHYHNLKCLYQKEEECIQKRVKQDFDEFIKKKYPGIKKTLDASCANFKKMQENYKESMDEIKKISEKNRAYNTLCEDVYKMRDEMIEVKKFMETFQKKIKKAFEL